MKAYLNGDMQETKNIGDILEPGYLFGWGVFETLRIYNGKAAFLEEHIERLKEGCEKILLDFPDVSFKEKIDNLLKENKLADAYCRITLFKKKASTGVLIYVEPFSHYKGDDYQNGFKAIISSFVKNSKNPLNKVKATSYLENRLAWKMAQERGRHEAIFLNEEGFLAEGSRANLFFIKGERIYSPSLECGILNGITRRKVIGVIKKKGSFLKEDKFKLKDLLSCDEAFLTSSLMEVMPLVEVDGQPIKNGKPGEITQIIHQGYQKLIL
ncbi:MAG: aminotransferase class IV family protein [Candidatus Omnitrophica bacterium]|nr:aminotransferase class IV family protein [Candidatus Omnitrophota bacterium]